MYPLANGPEITRLSSLFRYLRQLCVMATLSLLTPSTPADATTQTLATGSDEAPFEVVDDETAFLIGNTLFAIYHELGHALIDLLNLPVIGREEDAVDGLAALLMIPDEPNLLGDALIVAVADGWRAQSTANDRYRQRQYWGKHALDEQRHFAVVCLMVGSDQDGFYDYALEAGLPAQRIETCPEDFRNMKEGWQRLLSAHRPEAGAITKTNAAIPSISLVFDNPLPTQEAIMYRIREKGVLEGALRNATSPMALPSPVTIRFAVCEEANAYWSPDRAEVTVCYELIDAFQAILLDVTF